MNEIVSKRRQRPLQLARWRPSSSEPSKATQHSGVRAPIGLQWKVSAGKRASDRRQPGHAWVWHYLPGDVPFQS